MEEEMDQCHVIVAQGNMPPEKTFKGGSPALPAPLPCRSASMPGWVRPSALQRILFQLIALLWACSLFCPGRHFSTWLCFRRRSTFCLGWRCHSVSLLGREHHSAFFLHWRYGSFPLKNTLVEPLSKWRSVLSYSDLFKNGRKEEHKSGSSLVGSEQFEEIWSLYSTLPSW